MARPLVTLRGSAVGRPNVVCETPRYASSRPPLIQCAPVAFDQYIRPLANRWMRPFLPAYSRPTVPPSTEPCEPMSVQRLRIGLQDGRHEAECARVRLSVAAVR